MIQKIIKWFSEPIWQYINFSNIKTGDIVRTTVGFSSYQETGIVANKYADYLWIDVFINGRYIRSFTASKSYCTFGIFKKRFGW